MGIRAFPGIVVILLLCVSVTAGGDEVFVLHLDEGSGATAYDSSGNANNAIVHGATWVDGVSGRALKLNGPSEYVEAYLNGPVTGDFSIELWFRNNQTASHHQRLVDFGNSPSEPGFQLSIPPEGTVIIENSGGPFLNVQTSRQFNDGGWHMVAGVRSGSAYLLYADGEFIGSTPGSVGQFDHLFIGKGGATVPSNYYGIIDEIALYRRALGGAEVRNDYNATRPVVTTLPATTGATTAPTVNTTTIAAVLPATVKPAPGTSVILSKTASPQTIKQNQTVTVTITLENTGTAPLTGIGITDTNSTEFLLVAGSLTDTYPGIKPMEKRTIQYTLQARKPGTFILDPASAYFTDTSGNLQRIQSNSPMIIVQTPDQPVTPGFDAVMSVTVIAGAGLFLVGRKGRT